MPALQNNDSVRCERLFSCFVVDDRDQTIHDNLYLTKPQSFLRPVIDNDQPGKASGRSSFRKVSYPFLVHPLRE